ncbi:MAG TPA: ISNCY family transposase [Nitrospiraceae bacterium]|jgi:transposase|nr:ISNCY family transposase [Nitrospiraceae bacterium]
MAERDIITMNQKELKQLHVIHKVLEGSLTQKQAAEVVSLSERQIRRIIRRIEAEGDKGIQHRSRGKQSNRRLPKKLTERVVQLYQEKYQGFGPTLITEKLLELEGIAVSKETVRTWLIEAGQWQKGRKVRTHRQWRERKSCFGEMLQLDGSHHDWFEGRRPKCVLMAYIDDATSRVYGRFYEYEGTIPAMDSFKRYIRKYGIPMSIYMDKHTTYKSTAEPSIEDEINGTTPLSEFGRALTELAVEIIHAHSPQAKGRIERLFKTLQDRLVKEMTIRGISTIEEANNYLHIYLAAHNKRFAVKAKEQDDLHRDIPKGLNLDKILCIRTVRSLRNDFTVAHNSKLYQIEKGVKSKEVTVEERINGSMFITLNDVRLPFREITARPEKPKAATHVRRYKARPQPADHPWKKWNSRLFRQMRGQTKRPQGIATL